MARKTYSQYDIPYIVHEEDFKTLHITWEDVNRIRFQGKTYIVLMIPNSDPVKYEQCTKLLWADERKAMRDKRCRIPNGHGSFTCCTKSCKNCTEFVKYLPQSLENIQESHNVEPSSFDDELEALVDRLTVEDLLKTIYTLNAFYGEILKRKYAGDSERTIAKAVGLTHGTVNRELKKAYDLARKILEGRD